MGIIKEEKLIQREPYKDRVVVKYVCDGCGAVDDGGDYHYLPQTWIPITVEVMEHYDEGAAKIEHVYCAECADDILERLVEIGFSNHYHGSTNLLEDFNCPGYNDMNACPTPQHSRYGEDED